MLSWIPVLAESFPVLTTGVVQNTTSSAVDTVVGA